MDSNPFKKHNIIFDYKIKKSISPQPIFKNIIKKIKNIDSNELTKDDTLNKLDKNVDKKPENTNNNIILLRNNKYIKKLKLNNHTSNRDSNRNILYTSNNVVKKNSGCKIFSKNDINYILNSRGKTQEDNVNKKNKIIFNIINNRETVPEQNEQIIKKISHELRVCNENDLTNKLKKKKQKKFNKYNTTYKTEIIKDYYPNENKKKNSRKKEKTDISNIFISKRLDNSKHILYPLQSKMKTYTNISEIIKSNIINKKFKGKKLTIKDDKNKIKKIKKKLINKDETNDINDTNNNDERLHHHLRDNNSILEERIDFQDIPQRRPGCSGDKNITILNDTNYLDTKSIFKKKDSNKLQTNTTFTKSTRTSKLIYSNNELKGKYNINNGLTKTALKKFPTQRLNSPHQKKKVHKSSKNKHLMYYININNHIPRANNKLIKYLNFNLIETNIKNYSGLLNSLKNNNSFSSDIKKVNTSQNKKYKNSIINSLNIKKYIDNVIRYDQ